MATSAQTLATNHPEGLCRLTGVRYVEGGLFRLSVTFTEPVAGVETPCNFTGWTTVQADLRDPDTGAVVAPLSATYGADGVVLVTMAVAVGVDTLVSSRTYPNGRRLLLTVLAQDGSTWPIYIIAPSIITVTHRPSTAVGA